jgi:hypothetical protein
MAGKAPSRADYGCRAEISRGRLRQGRVLAVLASAVAAWGSAALPAAGATTGGAVPAARAAVPAAGSWGRAIEVPGLGVLNKGGNASVSEVSCASPGNCAAGGSYRDQHRKDQGFVASERNGRWGRAIEVPGLGALNGGGADVISVSCGSAGNCGAGGSYSLGVPGHGEISSPFVVTERRGRWGKVVTIGFQSGAQVGEVNSVSCTSAGNCLAGGDAGDCYCTNSHAFVVQERAGRWRSFRSVPGLWALGHLDSWVSSVACSTAGNCTVGGGYVDDNGNLHGFVADERDGAWAKAIEVPGLAALNAGEDAAVVSVACASAGNCAGGGYYADGDQNFHGFVASESNGVWGTAIEVPGLAALNKGGDAGVNSVACPSSGSCVAGGAYADGIVPPRPSGHLHGFVAVEQTGAWGTAIQVPGLAALNKGGRDTFVTDVSCAPAGGCAAGGYYFDRSGHHQGFVVSESNGVWGRAIELPGLGALNTGGYAVVDTLSCRAPGACAAGGTYRDSHRHRQGFVTQAR